MLDDDIDIRDLLMTGDFENAKEKILAQGDRAARALISLLEDETSELATRARAAACLVDIGDTTVLDSLLDATVRLPPPAYTLAASCAVRVGRGSLLTQKIIQRCENVDEPSRSRLIHILVRAPDPSAEQFLLQELQTANSASLRRSVSRALSVIGSKRAIPVIAKLLDEEKHEPARRWFAHDLIGLCGLRPNTAEEVLAWWHNEGKACFAASPGLEGGTSLGPK